MNYGNETETVEYKKTTGELKEAMVSISAILNKHGIGTIYFGIKNNGDVIGQDVSDSSLRDVSRMVYEQIKPQIYPVIQEVNVDGKSIIKVEFSGDEQPYSAAGRYYIRTADEDREVTPSELKQFFVNNEYRGRWENSKTDFLSKNVDSKAVKAFYQKAIEVGRLPEGKYTVQGILKRFGLSDGEYLNNAGNVLFGKNHPVVLKAAVFAGEEKLTFLDMQMYEDNIHNLLKTAESYILRNIRWKTEISSLERVEIPEIPLAVIREVLANSFAHAVYNGNTYHEICIFPNRVTIYNPGNFASPYTPDDYVKKQLESSIRNHKITKNLYLCKVIEQFGSGFKRIDSLCKDMKIRYSYENDPEGFKIIIYRNNELSVPVNVSVNVPVNITLNKMEQEVLNLLSAFPDYTREQMADATSKSIKTIQRTLKSLTQKGLIERVGSDKTGYWKLIEK